MQVYKHGNKYDPQLFECLNCGCIIELNQLEKIDLDEIENEKSFFTCPECLSLNRYQSSIVEQIKTKNGYLLVRPLTDEEEAKMKKGDKQC